MQLSFLDFPVTRTSLKMTVSASKNPRSFMQTLRTTKTSRRSVRPLHFFRNSKEIFEKARDPRPALPVPRRSAWPLLLRWTVQTRILTIPRLSWSYTQLVVVAEPAGSAPYGAPGDLNNLVELSLNNLAQKQQF